jgi:hypothetical protein
MARRHAAEASNDQRDDADEIHLPDQGLDDREGPPDLQLGYEVSVADGREGRVAEANSVG